MHVKRAVHVWARCQDIAEGRLRVVSAEYNREADIIMAWRRDSMGEAKAWFLREIPKLFHSR